MTAINKMVVILEDELKKDEKWGYSQKLALGDMLKEARRLAAEQSQKPTEAGLRGKKTVNEPTSYTGYLMMTDAEKQKLWEQRKPSIVEADGEKGLFEAISELAIFVDGGYQQKNCGTHLTKSGEGNNMKKPMQVMMAGHTTERSVDYNYCYCKKCKKVKPVWCSTSRYFCNSCKRTFGLQYLQGNAVDVGPNENTY